MGSLLPFEMMMSKVPLSQTAYREPRQRSSSRLSLIHISLAADRIIAVEDGRIVRDERIRR